MAFEGTALRRRPQRFEELIGQDFVAATLQKAIASGKIAHAYLFSGPRGCGKTTSARILAKALNCENGPTPEPCGVCTACTEIAKGSSLDVIEIDGASNTSVNDVRQIKDEILFPPNACKYKIYIIDEVHMLSTSAFNALLKTIEEPPPYVVFIFATTELHKVPATIKSRCQQFNFRLVSIELLKTALEAAAAESGIEAESDALYWVARQGNGSVRDTYMLFDQVAAFSDGHITLPKIQDKLKITGFDEINSLVESCAKKDAGAALSILDGIFEAGVSVEQTTTDFADYFRNLLFIKAGITKESILGQKPERFSKVVLDAWGTIQAERALEIMLNLYRDVRYSLDARCELELSVARLCWLSDLVRPDELQKAFRAARDIIGQGAVLPQQRGQQPSAMPAIAERSAPAREMSSPARAPEPKTEMPWGFSALKGANGAGAQAAIQGAAQAAPDVSGAHQSKKKTLTLDELPAALAEHFSHSEPMLSAIFPQSSSWKRSGGEISFSISSPLSFKRMEAKKGDVLRAIVELLGEEITLSISMEAPAEGASAPMLPPEVEAVCNVFRGNVVRQEAASQGSLKGQEQRESRDEDTEEA